MLEDFDFAVAEFMDEFGSYGTLRKNVGGTYDPNTGTVSVTPVDTQVRLILVDLTLQSNGLSAKYGTEIKAGDKEIYLQPPNKTDQWAAPIAIDPTTDLVIANGVTYKIVTMKEVNPTGTNPVVYSLYVRR